MDFYRRSIVTFKSKSAQCNGQAVYVLLYDFMYCLMTSCTAWWLYVLLDDFMYWLMNLRTILDDFMYWLINLLTADDFLHCRITLCTDWLIYLLLMTLCSAWWLYLLLDGLMYCLTTFDYYCMDYIILVENNNNLFSSFETQNRITLENN